MSGNERYLDRSIERKQYTYVRDLKVGEEFDIDTARSVRATTDGRMYVDGSTLVARSGGYGRRARRVNEGIQVDYMPDGVATVLSDNPLAGNQFLRWLYHAESYEVVKIGRWDNTDSDDPAVASSDMAVAPIAIAAMIGIMIGLWWVGVIL